MQINLFKRGENIRFILKLCTTPSMKGVESMKRVESMEEDLKFTETNQVVHSLREWEYFEETLEEAYKLREELRKYILEETDYDLYTLYSDEILIVLKGDKIFNLVFKYILEKYKESVDYIKQEMLKELKRQDETFTMDDLENGISSFTFPYITLKDVEEKLICIGEELIDKVYADDVSTADFSDLVRLTRICLREYRNLISEYGGFFGIFYSSKLGENKEKFIKCTEKIVKKEQISFCKIDIVFTEIANLLFEGLSNILFKFMDSIDIEEIDDRRNEYCN